MAASLAPPWLQSQGIAVKVYMVSIRCELLVSLKFLLDGTTVIISVKDNGSPETWSWKELPGVTNASYSHHPMPGVSHAVTSRAAILVTISESAVFNKVPIALQYTFTGRTSCQTFPSLFNWCNTWKIRAMCYLHVIKKNIMRGTKR